MAIEDATFVVQPKTSNWQHSCLGQDLRQKVAANSGLLICQDGDDLKKTELFTYMHQMWSTWVYNGDNWELPADHPGKSDYNWIDVKASHHKFNGSNKADYTAVSSLVPGDNVQVDGRSTVVQEIYEWSDYGGDRFSIKLTKRFVWEDLGQESMTIKGPLFKPVRDDVLFIVTDGDNGHKTVTGAQLNALISA